MIIKGEVLGRVTDYFRKKEYQSRGAPHHHILLWLEGAPVAGTDKDEVVLKWIQERITWRIPEEASNPELHQLVTKCQHHKCNPYRRCKKCVKGGTFITRCRFGFPRQECNSATLNCMKLSHTQMYNLVRACSEIRINNYNPLMLMLWKANMDIQYVGESTLAIAQYVTGYVTKAKRSKKRSSHNSIYSRLHSVFAACAPGSVVYMRLIYEVIICAKNQEL